MDNLLCEILWVLVGVLLKGGVVYLHQRGYPVPAIKSLLEWLLTPPPKPPDAPQK